jgi:hypothetical protein
VAIGRPEHKPSSWEEDQADLLLVHERSGLKPKDIQTQLQLDTNSHYYNVMHGKGGFKPAVRRRLRRLANQTRTALGLDLLPEEQPLDLDQGVPIIISSKELDFTVVKQVVTKREKVWVVEIRLNEEPVSEPAMSSSNEPPAP